MPPAARSPGAPAESAATRSRENRSLLSSVPILAHLDLDAFFAAVEELEDPSLRRSRSSSAATLAAAGRRDGELRRAPLRDPLGDECRRGAQRCPETVFVRPRHTLYRQYSHAVWGAIAESCRVSSAPGSTRATSTWQRGLAFDGARRLAEAVQVAVRRHDVALVLARRRRPPRSSARSPPTAQAGRHHRRATRARGAVPRSVAEPHPPRRRAEIRGAPRRRRRAHDRRARGALRRRAPGCAPGPGGAAAARPRRGVDPRELELEAERVSISTEETFDRDLADRAALHAELRRMAAEVASYLDATGSRRAP